MSPVSENVSHRNVITCQWWVHTTPGDLSPRGARSSLFLLWARERVRTNGSKDCIYCRSAGWGRNPWTLVDFRCLPSSAKPLRSWPNFADWGLDGRLDLPTTFWTGSVCVLDLWPQCFVCHKRTRRGGSVTWNVVDFHKSWRGPHVNWKLVSENWSPLIDNALQFCVVGRKVVLHTREIYHKVVVDSDKILALGILTGPGFAMTGWVDSPIQTHRCPGSYRRHHAPRLAQKSIWFLHCRAATDILALYNPLPWFSTDE